MKTIDSKISTSSSSSPVFNEDYSVDFEGKDDSFLIKSVTSYMVKVE